MPTAVATAAENTPSSAYSRAKTRTTLPAGVRAQHLVDHGVGFALLAAGRHGAGEHQQAVDDRKAANDVHRDRQLAEDFGRLVQRFADRDEGQVRIFARQSAFEVLLVPLGGLDGGKVGAGEVGEGTRRRRHHEVEARLELEVAYIGDGDFDELADERQFDRAARLDPEVLGDVVLERDEARPLIVGRPPLAGRDGQSDGMTSLQVIRISSAPMKYCVSPPRLLSSRSWSDGTPLILVTAARIIGECS